MKSIIRKIVNWAYGEDLSLWMMTSDQSKENFGIMLRDIIGRVSIEIRKEIDKLREELTK